MPTTDLVASERFAAELDRVVSHPPHALLVVGPMGIGKSYVAETITQRLFNAGTANNPHIRHFDPSGGIDMVRDMQQFVALKVPANGKDTVRILILESVDTLSNEAQNALLKLVEEPPVATMIIMTAISVQSVLPTIRSRTQSLVVEIPLTDVHKQFLTGKGYNSNSVDAVFKISGGLPGLSKALLDSDQTHPLYKAVQEARQILQQSTVQRLAAVDKLVKQKEQALQTIAMLSRMAQVALEQLATNPAADQKRLASWQNILESAHTAEGQLRANCQTKLVLTNLMLSI